MHLTFDAIWIQYLLVITSSNSAGTRVYCESMMLFVTRLYRVWAAVMCLKPIYKVSVLKALQISKVFVKFSMKQLVTTLSGTLNWLHGMNFLLLLLFWSICIRV